MKNFIVKNYVLITGLLSSFTIVLQQSLSKGESDWKALAYACLIAALGGIANSWKAKGLTVTGLIGNVAGGLYTLLERGSFTTNELVLASILAIVTTLSTGLTAFAPQEKEQP